MGGHTIEHEETTQHGPKSLSRSDIEGMCMGRWFVDTHGDLFVTDDESRGTFITKSGGVVLRSRDMAVIDARPVKVKITYTLE